MVCPECNELLDDFGNYLECPICGDRYDPDSDDDDPELMDNPDIDDEELE